MITRLAVQVQESRLPCARETVQFRVGKLRSNLRACQEVHSGRSLQFITPRRLGSGTATVDQMMIPADLTREPASDAMCSLGSDPMQPRSAVQLHLEHPSQACSSMPLPEISSLKSRCRFARNACHDVWHKTVVPACDRAIHTRTSTVPSSWTATSCRSQCLAM
jgi:hypothetical protein